MDEARVAELAPTESTEIRSPFERMIPTQAGDLAAHGIGAAIVAAADRLKSVLMAGPPRSFLDPIGIAILHLMGNQ